ncbi:hypothetical protein ACIGEP_16650 [Microbacterium sp. NPDC077663]|uniref:hypothetical protein n=1 Tax=Microbacterium sp. NPDC077663 TaxID=3364189 RepID=UPI0037CB0C0D
MDPTRHPRRPLDPTNANRYAYAGGDPINNTNLTGLAIDWEEVGYATVASAASLVAGSILGIAAAPICVTIIGCVAVSLLSAVGGGVIGETTAQLLYGREINPHAVFGA